MQILLWHLKVERPGVPLSTATQVYYLATRFSHCSTYQCLGLLSVVRNTLPWNMVNKMIGHHFSYYNTTKPNEI